MNLTLKDLTQGHPRIARQSWEVNHTPRRKNKEQGVLWMSPALLLGLKTKTSNWESMGWTSKCHKQRQRPTSHEKICRTDLPQTLWHVWKDTAPASR